MVGSTRNVEKGPKSDIKLCLDQNLGGCDHAAGEASFEEARNQNRRAGARSRRTDFLASRRRIGSSRTDGGRSTKAELHAWPGNRAQ